MKHFLIAATLAVFSAPAALAQGPNCAPHDVVAKRLSDIYGEQRLYYGVTEDGSVLAMWGNTETGSWTVTIRSPNGTMCVKAAGENLSKGDLIPAGVLG